MNSKALLGIVVIIILAVGGYYILTMPDQRTATEKAGDAVHDLDKGPDKAARQLESRTPGQKIGDEIKDSTSANHNP